MTFLSRSCVIGREGITFSICSAIAFASKMPTQIGSTFWPSASRNRMMGTLVTGSTISPLIVISICTALSPTLGFASTTVKAYPFACQAVGPPSRDADANSLAQPVLRTREIHDRIPPGAPGKIPRPAAAHGVNEHVCLGADPVRMILDLDIPLERLQR